MQKVLKHIPFVLPLLLMGFGLLAQVEFTASVNRSKVGKTERFNIEFTVNAEGSAFQAPDFDNFRVLGGPNRSTSMQIINFERSVKNTYSYVLMPRRTGTFQIGPASIKVDGKTYRTEPVTITVTEKSPRAQNPNDPHAKAADASFFRILPTKTTVFQGEPFLASYKLYFKNSVGGPSIVEEPDFTGFYTNKLELKNIQSTTEMYDGERYQTAIIRQLLLIPQQTGEAKLGPVEMEIPVQVATNRRDFFGRMLAQTVNINVERDFPNINVMPLPREGRPSGFGGAVGNYDFSVELSRNELSSNESLTLKVKISGKGNIKLVDAPEPDIPTAFEVYDPKIEENVKVSAAGMSGSKTYEYLLIPRYGGTYKIPEMAFSYFDPNRRRYETITSEEMEVTVTGAAPKPGETNGAVAAEKENVDFIGKDILFIKTDPGDLQLMGDDFYASGTYFTMLGLMVAILAGMLGLYAFRRRRPSGGELTRSKRAGKVARKHLGSAKKALKEAKQEVFYEALSAALWGYFSDKFGIPQSRLSKDLIRETLLSKGVETETADKVIETMNRAEMARFTSAKASTPNEDYEQTAALLTKIENKV